MKMEIVSRVAEYVRNPTTRKKEVTDTKPTTVVDKVDLSAQALQKSKVDSVDTKWEKDHLLKLERIAAQVSTQNYKMNPKMVDAIAEKIVNLVA
jgi:hypothetical protein